MEKDRGVALTQHHLLSLRVTGNDIKALEEFRTKFDYIYQALDTGERPTDSAMRSLMFEQLKNHHLRQREHLNGFMKRWLRL